MKNTDSPAQAALEAICAKRGEVLPHVVVKEAENPKSPLHPYFDWSDTSAAHKYRLQQAESLIRRFRVTYVTPDGAQHNVRRFLNVQVSKPRKGDGSEPLTYRAYKLSDEVLGDDEYRAQVLSEALAMAKAFRSKYGSLKELAPIIDAVEVVEITLRSKVSP